MEEIQGYIPMFIILFFLRTDTSISPAIPILKLAEGTLGKEGWKGCKNGETG